jgi:lipoate-protein ligase A
LSHHGEYKVPGGKLVVADFDVIDGKLAGVRITGDFFLYPDSALAEINAALEAASVAAGPEVWSRLIRDRLPADVEMLGFGPDDVATAIARGLAG